MVVVCLQFAESAFEDFLSDHFFHSSSVACPTEPPAVSCSDPRRFVFLCATAPCLLSSCSAFAPSDLPCRISVVLPGVVYLPLVSLLKAPSKLKKIDQLMKEQLMDHF